MHSPDTAAPATTGRSRRTLWLILAVCMAPIVASYVAFYLWRPAGHVNYGELLEPRQVPDVALATLEGKPFGFAALRGEWVLVTLAPASCDEKCRRNLVYTRQVRLAQGRETERVERVWLLSDDGKPDAALLAEHPGLHVLRGARAIVSALPAPRDPADHIYVVDPLGHAMMRFPADPDPRKVLKDLSRLLRHSKWK